MKKAFTKKALLALLALLLGFSISGCDWLNQDPYHLTVKVLDFEGDPLEGMQVTSSRGAESGNTDEDGRVSLSDLRGTQEVRVIDPERETGFPAQTITPDDEGQTITIQAQYHLHWGKIEGEITISEPEGLLLEYSVRALDGHPENDDPDTIESLGRDDGAFDNAPGEEFTIEVKIREDHETGEKNNTVYVIAEVGDLFGESYYRGMYGVNSPGDWESAKRITLEDGDTYSNVDFELFPYGE